MEKIIRLFNKTRNLFSTLYAGYRGKLLALSCLGIFSGLLDGLGVSLLVPLFTYLVGNPAMSSNFLMRFLTDFTDWFGIYFGFKTLLLMTIALFILKAIVLYYFGITKTRIVANYTVSLRQRMYRGLLGTSFSFLRRQKIGHIDSILLNDVRVSSRLLDNLITTLLSVTTLIAYVFISLALSVPITLLATGIGFLVILGFRPLGQALRNYSRRYTLVTRETSHEINEMLIGIKAIRAFGVENFVIDVATKLFRRAEKAETGKQNAKFIMKVSIEPLSAIFIVVLFALSYKFLQFDVVSFVSIVYLIQQIFLRVDKLQTSANIISESMHSAESVLTLLEQAEAFRDIPSGVEPFSFEKSLDISKVSFAYEHSKSVLKNISLKIKKGSTLGIIGPSGAGKTTIVDMLLRLIYPTEGVICIDDVDILKVNLSEWRRKVIYVAQDVFLKNASIYENIKFYDGLVSGEKIVESVKMANIDKLVASLPQGLETVIGERGTNLSGGERQRIVLARALARDPDILVLDEATSSLDQESEEAIKNTLLKIKGKVTIIIIAHRLSSISDADRLVVIDHGFVVEEGVPCELLKNPNSYFYRMSELGQV